MLADCLTTRLPGSYTRNVFSSRMWTLGPDDRAPSFRRRNLQDPERAQTQPEADELNKELNTYISECCPSLMMMNETDEFDITTASLFVLEAEKSLFPHEVLLTTDDKPPLINNVPEEDTFDAFSCEVLTMSDMTSSSSTRIAPLSLNMIFVIITSLFSAFIGFLLSSYFSRDKGNVVDTTQICVVNCTGNNVAPDFLMQLGSGTWQC